MTDPSPGERDLASRLGLEPAAVAASREVFNAIAELPWPEPERISFLARLAHEGRADVGLKLGRLALRAAPVIGLDQLIPLPGIGEKRVAGLVRALSPVAVDTFQAAASDPGLRRRIRALEAERTAIRDELDRLLAGNPQPVVAGERADVMRVGDVASSVASQTAVVAGTLRAATSTLQLAGVDVHLDGAAVAVGSDLAMDFAARGGGSTVSLRFAPSGLADQRDDVRVPDVVGYTRALAVRKLEAAGFESAVSSVVTGPGVVSDQAPRAGDLASRGTRVRLVIGGR